MAARRAIVLAALLLAPLGAAALPALPPSGALALTLWAPPRVAANASFMVSGAFELHPGGDASAPLPAQTVVLVVDGADAGQATTDSDGAYSATLPGIAAGHHQVIARAEAQGVVLAQSEPRAVLAVLPPAAPSGLAGGPGAHTGQVALSWSAPPADELRPVDSYLVWRRAGARLSLAAAETAGTTSAGDTQPPGVPVDYRVTALNLAGSSDPTPWITVTPALPPPADHLEVHATSVDVCHAGTCSSLGPWDYALVGSDQQPVDLRVHASGRLTDLGAPVDLEPLNGTISDLWNDQLAWHNATPLAFAGKTAAEGGFALVAPVMRVPNVLPSETCLEEALTVGAHYPGVAVPAGLVSTNLTATDTITVYLC